MRARTARVGPDEGVVNEGIGRLDLVKHERGVTEVAGVGKSAEGDDFADGVVVEVEAAGEEEGVDGLELTHVGAALRQRHEPLPCLDAGGALTHV